MAQTLSQIQARGVLLFEKLFAAELADETQPDPASRRFSWFRTSHAIDASALALRFSALADTAASLEEGLEAVLDVAETEPTARGLLRQALSIFVTHNTRGRNLVKPRTVTGAPELFRSTENSDGSLPISEGGASPALDYWREDPLANEHHEHWHQVYPFTGVPVRDFRQWVEDTSNQEMAAVLLAWRPGENWLAALEAASPEDIASFFEQFVAAGLLAELPRNLQNLFLVANDRHGELFVYMHAQMLARYNAELASHGLPAVEPWGPDQWRLPVPSGHNPIEVAGFFRRPTMAVLNPQFADLLDDLQAPVDDAIAAGQAVTFDGGTIPLDEVVIGEVIEAAAPWTTDLDTDTETGTYRGLHNTGHGILATLAPDQFGRGGGVMNNPVVAIRDPIFWRWHAHVDNVAQGWLDTRDPEDLSIGPTVTLRNGLGGSADPWASPDLILVDSAALPSDPVQAGIDTFAGTSWDEPAAAAQGPAAVAVVDELTTRMETWDSPIGPIDFLTHDPFSYYLRLENTEATPVDTTVRIFIAPADASDDRRAWIEMDKFRVTLESGRNVLYRPDTEAAVIKRPAETTPASLAGGSSANESGYCDCGWPYTLLLPRGSNTGMEFRMVVFCSRWEDDQVAEPAQCGSMSFCGAVDRYPDLREMGYPFARRFAQTIQDTVVTHGHSAGRSFRIRHTP